MNIARIIEKNIEYNGLRPATQRDLSVFTLSCVAYGYTTILHKRIGISAGAVGGLGSGIHWHSMLNEPTIAEKTRKLLGQLGGTFEKKILASTQKYFRTIKHQLTHTEQFAVRDPERYLFALIDLYPQYMACIGVYNCFWRFIGDGTNATGLTKRQIAAITRARSRIAVIYPRVEKRILAAARMLGKQYGITSDLLSFCTRNEFTERAYTFPAFRKKLIARRKKYFYLYTEDDNREYIVTGSVADAIARKYYAVDTSRMHEVRGQSAFPGIVRGVVSNMIVPSAKKHRLHGHMILVTSMTHPDNVALVKKATAIVTDEGGVLCHAAIVARELKTPCVIGTKIATKIFKDGDRVEVDAMKGIVRKIT